MRYARHLSVLRNRLPQCSQPGLYIYFDVLGDLKTIPKQFGDAIQKSILVRIEKGKGALKVCDHAGLLSTIGVERKFNADEAQIFALFRDTGRATDPDAVGCVCKLAVIMRRSSMPNRHKGLDIQYHSNMYVSVRGQIDAVCLLNLSEELELLQLSELLRQELSGSPTLRLSNRLTQLEFLSQADTAVGAQSHSGKRTGCLYRLAEGDGWQPPTNHDMGRFYAEGVRGEELF